MEGWGAEARRERMGGLETTLPVHGEPRLDAGCGGWETAGGWGVSGNPLLPPPTSAPMERSPQGFSRDPGGCLLMLDQKKWTGFEVKSWASCASLLDGT